MRGQKKGPSGCDPGTAPMPGGGRDKYIPSADITRKTFLNSLIASLLTTAVELADRIHDDETVDDLVVLKMRHDRRARG